MKNAILVILVAAGLCNASAQVLNDARILSRGDAALGIAPVFYTGGRNTSVRVFIDAGFGIGSGTDLAFRAGLGQDPAYLGADVEFALSRSALAVSATLGAHKFADLGIDGALNLSISSRLIGFYFGIDADLEFASNNTQLPVWMFFGPRVFLQRNLEFLFEVDIKLTDDASNIFAVGLKVYL